MHYRKEIDGLRAVAVLPVILFHAGLDLFSGGFVGVDVFFVISGFLITRIIAEELERGQFSVLRFYERRARRILPALFCVVAATSVAALVLMLPYQLQAFGQGLGGVAGFFSNIVFWRQSGYFAAAAELNPLLHTWSLSVEEQFYLFIPLIMAGLWGRVHRRTVGAVLAAGFLVSLVLAQLLTGRMPGASFYLLPTRAWELLAGSLLALWMMRRPAPAGGLPGLLALIGLGAIGASVLLYSAATPFPSLWTLVPVLGTLAVLYGARAENWAGRVLSLRWIVGIGLISYSAYLWHQPLFAFARMLDADMHPPLAEMLGLSGLALLLAWGSWAFVERPFRRGGFLTRGQVFGASGAGLVAMAVLGGALIVSHGLPGRFPAPQRAWITEPPKTYARYVTAGYDGVRGRPLSDSRPNLVLVGDSFSQDFFNILAESDLLRDHAVTAIYVPARCQIHFGQPAAQTRLHIAPQDRRMCEQRALSPAQVQTMRQADVLVLSARWTGWAAALLPQSLRAMNLPADQRLLVIGPKEFELNRRALLDVDPAQAAQLRRVPSDEVRQVNRALQAQLPAGAFVDILGTVCAQGCPIFTENGALISYDGLHLTQEGAAFIGAILAQAHPLGPAQPAGEGGRYSAP
ncbi:acyltransferase family protein [Thalassobius sp. S69A]|uniref:acyltransferase family protein n=1 Tax=unclassified Thalassovita TaxID=2619711 RepID=UPI000C0D3F59|nr:acyltransferase [Paracoccaceae bacterium]MBT26351.1 acyltransferase [Paracoccaceae bacterium]